MEGEKKQTHWKKLTNPNYIGAYCMPPDKSDVILTIKKVVREMVVGDGGKKEECTVAHFKENSKPMILNRTNCKTITSIYATPYIEEWVDKKIQIFVAQVKVAGEIVDGLRIRPIQPQVGKPELFINTPAFNKCKEHLNSGGKIEDIEGKYSVSSEVKEALCN